MSRDETLFLVDIFESCQKILKFTTHLSYIDFVRDDLRYDATLRNLEMIGEAAKNISEETRIKYADVKWRKMAGFRDILAHNYFGISDEIVWDIVENEIPRLAEQIQFILNEKLSMLKNYRFLLLIALPLLTLDQWSKALIRANLALGEMWGPEWLMPYARFVHWKNTGAAFGMFQGGNTFFAILAIIVSTFILYYFGKVPAQERLLRLAMSLMFVGSVGNLIDRLTQGYVTDFISVGTFAVFNVADSSISIGVAVLLLATWLQERREKAAKQADVAAIESLPLEGESHD